MHQRPVTNRVKPDPLTLWFWFHKHKCCSPAFEGTKMTQRGLVSGGNHCGCEGGSDREARKEGGWKESRKWDLLPRRLRWTMVGMRTGGVYDRHNDGGTVSGSSACWWWINYAFMKQISCVLEGFPVRFLLLRRYNICITTPSKLWKSFKFSAWSIQSSD